MNATLFIFYLLFILLSIMDVGTTYIGLSRGLTERNPFINDHITNGHYWYSVYEKFMSVFDLFFVFYFLEKKFNKYIEWLQASLLGVNVLLCIVIISNLWVLL